MGTKMRQLLYVSNTARDIAASDLNAILESARRNNQVLGLTGLLLYIDGGFLQILEGEERTVHEVYGRIRADRRHWEARLLLDREAPRAFGHWSMGFERLTGEDPETAGMFGVTREAIAGKLSPAAGKMVATMLETFYRVQRGDLLGLRDTG
jgi:Sensors of blue-light using FAD